MTPVKTHVAHDRQLLTQTIYSIAVCCVQDCVALDHSEQTRWFLFHHSKHQLSPNGSAELHYGATEEGCL